MLPGLPQLRTIAGAVGTYLTEIRQFLAALKDIKLLSGKEVVVTFTSSDVAGAIVKRIVTGLEYPATGYFIIRGHTSNDLSQEPVPTTETDTTTLYLRAFAAGTYTLWVF